MSRSKYGAVDEGTVDRKIENKDNDYDETNTLHDMEQDNLSTPKISHLFQKRFLEGAATTALTTTTTYVAPSAMRVTSHASFPHAPSQQHQQVLQDNADDQESLVSFRTATTPPDSPTVAHIRMWFDFGSFASNHSWRRQQQQQQRRRQPYQRHAHSSSSMEEDNTAASHGTHHSWQSWVGDSVRTVVTATFPAGNATTVCDVYAGQGTASWTSEIWNLCKNLVGAGALALPSGVAAFANTAPPQSDEESPSTFLVWWDALIPATLVIIGMGAIFAYYFFLVGRLCRITRTSSYREAWEVIMLSGSGGGGGVSHSTRSDVSVSNDANEKYGSTAALVALFVLLMAGLGNLAYSMILADTTRSLLATAGIWLTRTQCLILMTVVAL